MNKRKIDDLIPRAYELLGKKEEGKNGLGIMSGDTKKNGQYRGQIASFGAAVAQGSILSAVSFFSSKGGSEVERQLLMTAIAKLINYDGELYQYVIDNDRRVAKNEILHAAVALKLVMNLYDLGK